MKQWYFIHTYSGHENKVVESLAARIRDMELGEQITEVKLPKEKVVEMRGNKEHVSERMFYPGYVLVDHAWVYLLEGLTWLVNKLAGL